MKPFDFPVYVSRPYLPPFDDFVEGLREIWGSRWLSNNGPIVRRLESKLAEFFETDNVSLFNNGTLALQIALQGLRLEGEVITTPFTFVATSNAIVMSGLRPVFVDIEPDYFSLDPEKIEASITANTSAILAVHPFGYPCKLEYLEGIAKKHRITLIYDAAHAFGVKVNGGPITGFGDVSMLSFHATKPYHTVEGGALVFRDGALKKQFDCMKNSGIENDSESVMIGTNAKMNEFQALMGEIMLNYFPCVIGKRRELQEVYRERLSEIPGVRMPPEPPSYIEHNYAFIAVQIACEECGISRDDLSGALRKYNIFSKKYFSPLIPDLACYRGMATGDPLSNARKVASRVLVLPLYADLSPNEVHQICDIIAFLCRA